MSYVFISYSKANMEYARALSSRLQEEGFDVWIDQRLRTSDNWWETIVLALKECTAFVVIMTPESRESKWVRRETMLADQWDKPLFPILLAGENWEIFVATQYHDVRTSDSKPPDYGGKLPSADFFATLSQKVRKGKKGADRSSDTQSAPIALSAEVRGEINNPPPAEDSLMQAKAKPEDVRPLETATADKQSAPQDLKPEPQTVVKKVVSIYTSSGFRRGEQITLEDSGQTLGKVTIKSLYALAPSSSSTQYPIALELEFASSGNVLGTVTKTIVAESLLADPKKIPEKIFSNVKAVEKYKLFATYALAKAGESFTLNHGRWQIVVQINNVTWQSISNKSAFSSIRMEILLQDTIGGYKPKPASKSSTLTTPVRSTSTSDSSLGCGCLTVGAIVLIGMMALLRVGPFYSGSSTASMPETNSSSAPAPATMMPEVQTETAAATATAQIANPITARDFFERGNVYYGRGQYQQAIDDYTRAIQLSPSLSPAYYNRGLVYMQLGFFELAVTEFSTVIDLDPNLIDAHRLLGEAYFRLRYYSRALESYQLYLELAGSNAQPGIAERVQQLQQATPQDGR